MSASPRENIILLAINAIQTLPGLSIRHAAKMYDLPEATIRHRMKGRMSRAEMTNANLNLTTTEEKVIVQYIIQQDSRGFSPWPADVEDMANVLLMKRGAQRVGKHWTERFIKWCPELKMHFNRIYDYQRGLCEDPAIIEPWFQLVHNMHMKYSIQDSDFYNFDETGFMMGMIRPGMVVTWSDRVGKPKGIQPGNREWATAICYIAGDGYAMPPFLVVQGHFHLTNWFAQAQIPDDWAIKTTANGWTDNKTGLQWV
jgi:hypothetical protein